MFQRETWRSSSDCTPSESSLSVRHPASDCKLSSEEHTQYSTQLHRPHPNSFKTTYFGFFFLMPQCVTTLNQSSSTFSKSEEGFSTYMQTRTQGDKGLLHLLLHFKERSNVCFLWSEFCVVVQSKRMG